MAGRTVKVEWTAAAADVENPAAGAQDHYVVGCGTQEHSVALDQTSAIFTDVPAGSVAIWVSNVDVNGNELFPPLTGNIDVPALPQGLKPATIVGTIQ